MADLETVNALIERAIDSWNLPERVKRLSLPLYHYHEHDLEFLELVVADVEAGGIVGVAAWETADPGDAPPRGESTRKDHRDDAGAGFSKTM